MAGLDLATRVSTARALRRGPQRVDACSPSEQLSAPPAEPRFHVVAYDFGIKRNILRRLVHVGCRVTVVPAGTTAEDVLALEARRRVPLQRPRRSRAAPVPGGASAQAARPEVPIFGICLGHQMLGLALGRQDLQAEVRPPRRQPPGAEPASPTRSRSPRRTTASRSTRIRSTPTTSN